MSSSEPEISSDLTKTKKNHSNNCKMEEGTMVVLGRIPTAFRSTSHFTVVIRLRFLHTDDDFWSQILNQLNICLTIFRAEYQDKFSL